jgi:hypothetical protein
MANGKICATGNVEKCHRRAISPDEFAKNCQLSSQKLQMVLGGSGQRKEFAEGVLQRSMHPNFPNCTF